MLEEEEEELDDETIQARVDASLAKIYEVTSTWLKPKKTPSAPKRDFEKELKEIMRHPPRLGVGAELPEKQVNSGPSEMKLKNKMLGKKREREEKNGNDATVDPTPEDDEEESKSRVIQKKPRLDPFASGKKKGKGLSTQAIVPPHKPAGTPPAFEIKPESEDIAISTKDEDTPGASSSKNTLDMAPTSRPTVGGEESGDEEEGEGPVSKSVAAVPRPTPDLPPILNLHRPPAIRDEAEPSPKKKRRKKKKKHRVGGEAGGVASQTLMS